MIEPMEQPEDETVADISVDSSGNVMPEKHNKLIIIDADTIAFASCSVCSYEAEVLGDVTDEDLRELVDKHMWDPETKTYMDINPEEALKHAKEKINLILDRTGGKIENVQLHFTGGRDSFRYHLLKYFFPEDETMWYKFKRTKKASPAGLQQLKMDLLKAFKGDIYYKFEADEVVVLLKKQHGEDAILTAVDKDVIKNTVGTHWNYYEEHRYNKVMKWDTYTEDEANYYQHLQVLTGDSSDNVPGLPGIGPAKAAKFIRVGMKVPELVDALLAAYKQKCNYGDYALMCMLNMQLVNMHQLNENYEIDLWRFMMTGTDLDNEVLSNIEQHGVKYTSSVWQNLKSKNKTLTSEEAELYSHVQKAHYGFTGHQLPALPGAHKTRAQARDDLGPEVKDEVIEKAVQGGLAARLAAMRKDK